MVIAYSSIRDLNAARIISGWPNCDYPNLRLKWCDISISLKVSGKANFPTAPGALFVTSSAIASERCAVYKMSGASRVDLAEKALSYMLV